jgi:DNA invertase Pin-like site-specific DNA recombinase
VFPRHPGVLAEFETNLRKERQLEGIADAKARGASGSAGRAAAAVSIDCSTKSND